MAYRSVDRDQKGDKNPEHRTSSQRGYHGRQKARTQRYHGI